jgi:hypothetical protein
MIKVSSMGIMNALEIHEENEVCHVLNDDKYFKYVNGAWEEIELPKGELNMNLYAMNKSLMAQLPDIKKKDLIAGKEKIKMIASDGVYFMLLCNELKYYTVFCISSNGTEKIEDVVIDCIKCFGATIKSIDSVEGNALEIWIQKDDEAYAMYFFNYDEGVEICAI